ncbi:MAG: AraC family transcriptional regulator ligand-binding domain-containing protein [Moraxellaceae bacterium]|nr:AraC family transcriptional regulator ligand-binding domain-containing protein [Moraxellaceae bacterium]
MKSGQSPARRRQTLPGIPGIYVLLFCDLLRELGYDESRLLDGMPFDRARLLQPDCRVQIEHGARVVQRGLLVAGHEGLGFRYASALKVTLHGSLGLLALSSLTLRDALEAGTRYLSLRAPFLEFLWSEENDVVMLELRTLMPLGRHTDFIMEAMLMGLVYMLQQLNDEAVDGVEVWMTGHEPPHYAGMAERLPVPVHFGKPACMVRGSVRQLERRPRLADPAVAALAREQCEAEFHQLFAVTETLGDEVRRRLLDQEEGAPSLEQMAEGLHVSSRTLKRRLQEEGQNYRDIVDEVLRERATRLLVETDLPVSEIAFRVGYNDVSNFARAFKRWTGQTPRDYRRE